MKTTVNRTTCLVIVFLSGICLLGCTSNEQKEEPPEEKRIVMEENAKAEKPKKKVTSSKPKTSKRISDLETVPKDQKFDEIKIIPIGRPHEEKNKKDDENDKPEVTKKSDKDDE